MNNNINFTCPFCHHDTTITLNNHFEHFLPLELSEPKQGKVGVNVVAITCPNSKCNELYLAVSLNSRVYKDRWIPNKEFQNWILLPESEALVLPKYIPKAIREDYYEACRIKALSPKASATLSRRCLQGMIRDFFGIKKGRLIDEINELQNLIDPLVWEGIEAIRNVGNIGAHMEKDINIIIEVEPKESQLLITLIERLIKDWYIDKHNKEQQLKKIKQIVKKKENTKKVTSTQKMTSK